MTNGEFYEDDMNNLEATGKYIAIINGQPKDCAEVDCNQCARYTPCGDHMRCSALKLMQWAFSEYIPPKPKLTKRQRAFCECFAAGWLVRQNNGTLVLFNWFPNKTGNIWCRQESDPICPILMNEMFPEFPFITSKDEPINIFTMLLWGEEEEDVTL